MKPILSAVVGAAIFFPMTISSAHAGPQQEVIKKRVNNAMRELLITRDANPYPCRVGIFREDDDG